jgi:hypothetical protein
MNPAGGLRPQGGESQQQYLAQARVYSLILGGANEKEEYTDEAAGIFF